MTLQKAISFDHSITELGCIQVRKITRIMEDDKEVSKSFHRHVVSPGDDTTGEDAKTIALAETIHTQEVIDTYKAMIEGS